MRLASLIAAIFLLGAIAPASRAAAAEPAPIMVFAAASLNDAVSALAKAYEARTHHKVVTVFAASSRLAKQIDASAGADLFLSADQAWMDYLEKNGRIIASSRQDLLTNDLVLIGAKDSSQTITITPGFDLVKALNGGRLAIADPDAVPAGRYAKEALSTLGVWRAVEPHLAPAEDVRMALAFVARGEAPLGIVYRTDARIAPEVRIIATFPPTSHPPIIYPAALVTGATPAAAGFLAYLTTPEAKAIFEKYGFGLAAR